MTESAATAPRYLQVAPSSCLRVVDGDRWVTSVTVRVGAFHVAIRAGSLEVEQAILEMLGPHVVDDPAAPASFGIQATRSALPSARPLFQVYEGCSPVLTSRSCERTVAFVAGLLERLLPRRGRGAGTLRLAVHAIVSDDRAFLVPWRFPYRLPAAEIHLDRRGLRQLETTYVEVEPDRGSVMVAPSRLLSCPAAASSAGRASSPATTPGSREIIGWAFAGRREPLSRAQGLARGMGTVHGAPTATAAFRGLAAVIERLDLLLVCTPEEMLELAAEELAHRASAVP